MARRARSLKEIGKIKDRIIEEAMMLILEKGFDNMSLRNLANRVGMSATNLYYYYSGKDEIYLNIQIRGFEMLQEKLEAVPASVTDPHDTLERTLKAYLEFGFDNPDYYQIMLNSNSPRYLEYKQTNDAIEPVAFAAKQAAINSIAAPLKQIRQILVNKGKYEEKAIFLKGYQIWITLHGIVTLNNRKILLELDEVVPEELIEHVCTDLVRSI